MSDPTLGRRWSIPLILLAVISFGLAHDMDLAAAPLQTELAHGSEAEAETVPHVATVCAMVLAVLTLLGPTMAPRHTRYRNAPASPAVFGSHPRHVHFSDLPPPRMRSYDFCPILA